MISLNGDPLRLLLKEAFKVPGTDRIIGPSWLDVDCFQIAAKLPDGASQDQIPAMLRMLLVERFKLAFHNESRAIRGYALVVDKSGSKLKESDSSSPANALHAGQITFGAGRGTALIRGSMTTSALSQQISNRLKSPVENLTGLNGTYDVDLSWAPESELGGIGSPGAPVRSGAEDTVASLPVDSIADIFTAIRSELGLRLEPRNVQAEFVVIDRIERIPAEN